MTNVTLNGYGALRADIRQISYLNGRLATYLVLAHALRLDLIKNATALPERPRWWHRLIPPFVTRRLLMTALSDLTTNLAAATTAAIALGTTIDAAVTKIQSAEDNPAIATAAQQAGTLKQNLTDLNTKLAAAVTPTP